MAGAVNKNPTDPGHLSPHAGTQLEKKRKVQETHFLVYMNVFCGQVFHSSCSCFENEHTRQQKYTTMPKNLDFYGDSHPYRKSPRQTLSEKKKVEESCSCWIDFLLSPAYFPDSGKAGGRGVWWVCGGGGGLNGNRMTLYSPTVAVDLCLQLTCASPIIYLASLCFVMFTCSSDIVKLTVIVCALAYMSTR